MSGTPGVAVPGTVVPIGSLTGPGGAQGVQGIQGTQGITGATLPVGSVIAYCSGGTPPAGWMTADGSAVSRTLYPDLFTAIGTTYGTGDGSTTFNLPDLRSRTIVGTGQGSGLTNRALAATGGEETHVLSGGEMPVHAHPTSDPGHIHYVGGITYYSLTSIAAGPTFYLFSSNMGGTQYQPAAGANVTSVTVGNAGSGLAHNTMPPFLVVVWIIKVSVTGGPTAQAPIADATQNGLLRQLSGSIGDYVGGDNTCHPLPSTSAGFFTLTAAYTMALTDRGKYAICTGGSWTLTLPQAVAGLSYIVRNDQGVTGTTGIITIQPTGGTINGVASLALLAGQEIQLLTDGTNWRGFGRQRDVIIGAVTFTNVGTAAPLLLPAGYDQFELYFSEILPSVTDGNVQMQLSNDGGNTWIADGYYYCSYAYVNSPTAWAVAAQPAIGFWYLTHFLETIPRSYLKIQLHPGNANQFPEYLAHSTQYYATGGTPSQFILGGFCAAAQARANAASFNLNSGTITRLTVTVKGICII